ncbi:hypothetical protein Nans01_47820 [Nocardiopsis ansamitocini]|uniref:Htaa domain-containing protein n=1 Tax=Nocardiopsis ansamitocini TaxID=1670832 RepID=A0A9W6UIZ9_9ACTN|nr:hypothetical protein Nans01_47820 [Nocardiopsis ansamitocini]
MTWTDVPATLTPEGVPAFADFYAVGDPLGPVTIQVSGDGPDEDGGSTGDGSSGAAGGDGAQASGSGTNVSGALPSTGRDLAPLTLGALALLGAGAAAIVHARRERTA